MPEFRQNPIVDGWVSVSTERRQRPSDFPLRSGTQCLDVSLSALAKQP
jgi:galactose-1-phosphate uridylyltransferase